MTKIALPVAAALACGFLMAAAAPQKNDAADAPYEVLPGWPQLAHPYPRPGYVMGSQAGIFAESSNRIFLGSRGELKLPDKLPATFDGYWESAFPAGKAPRASRALGDTHNMIMIVDANGKLVDSWTQWDHLFDGGRGPHSIRINPFDPERHVWVVNDTNHQVYEFTNDGSTLVRSLGIRDVAGEDQTHFRQPTDIAFLPDGTFFVADGSGNSRVVKFDRGGNYLMAWGKKGTGPGEFDLLHMIAVGPDRRVYVADRSNKRIQIFDENGKFIAQWPNEFPQALMFSAEGHLRVFGRGFMEYDLNGNVLSTFDIKGITAHEISVDEKGNLYGAGEFSGRPFKFVPKAGVDPAKIIHPVALAGKEVSTAPGSTNFAGTWKLEKSEPVVKTEADAFGAAAPTLTITQSKAEVATSTGKLKQVFKLDGSVTVDASYTDPDSGGEAKTTAHWDGEKLVLVTHQGFNTGRDILSLKGNVLTVDRDLSMVGGAYPVVLTYRKQ